MKYWLYLFAKLLAAGIIVFVLQQAFEYLYPMPPPPPPGYGRPRVLFLNDVSFTFGILAIWLVGAGLFFAALWDQRRRCRTCLRRLIMPISSGSWGHMVVFGRPKTEWICAFGHGTLSFEELQITGRLSPDWQPHDDNIWKELESFHQAQK